MIKEGYIVKLISQDMLMVVNSISQEDSFNLVQPSLKGDCECVWWDGKFHYDTFSPVELEVIETAHNLTFSVGDQVVLKSGSDKFVVIAVNDDELELNGGNGQHCTRVFKKA